MIAMIVHRNTLFVASDCANGLRQYTIIFKVKA